MNINYQIYQAPEKDIPIEDKARLEGYLKGRSDADSLQKLFVEELNNVRKRK